MPYEWLNRRFSPPPSQQRNCVSGLVRPQKLAWRIELFGGKLAREVCVKCLTGGHSFPPRRLSRWVYAAILTVGSSAEAEFQDFFDNAPIAMHWLGGTGNVVWANKMEMAVLGYTAEEYIGQPITKFCPDEEELVLKIFHNLSTGNSISDVPVRAAAFVHFRSLSFTFVHFRSLSFASARTLTCSFTFVRERADAHVFVHFRSLSFASARTLT
eukprot:1184879-Prorocentrum_minimum.AAC.3